MTDETYNQEPATGPANFSWGEAAVSAFVFLAMLTGAIVVVFWSSGLLGERVRLGALFLVAMLYLFLALGLRITDKADLVKKWTNGDLDEEVGFYLGTFLAGPVLFAASISAFHSAFPAHFSGDVAESDSWWDFLLFATDNAAEAIFFDVPAIYSLSLTNLSPTSFVARSCVLVYRLAIDFMLVAGLLDIWKFSREQKQATAPV